MTGPLKWHGGKTYLADWIISLMPPRCKNPNAPAADDAGWMHYVEPYFGGGAVLLANDPEGISEVVNDINIELTNFWRVLSLPKVFELFVRRAQAVPFSQTMYGVSMLATDSSYKGDGTPEENSVAAAIGFFIRCRQSLSGRMKDFASITRNRTRRGMNEQVSAWLNCVEGLPEVHARLKRVLILNDDALNVIRKQDGPRTLFYLDPPYLHETRATTGEYEHEMDENEHADLLVSLGGPTAASVAIRFRGELVPTWWNLVKPLQGRFLLSGYHSDLYDEIAKACGWKCHEFKIDNKAAGGKAKRTMTECVWTNF